MLQIANLKHKILMQTLHERIVQRYSSPSIKYIATEHLERKAFHEQTGLLGCHQKAYTFKSLVSFNNWSILNQLLFLSEIWLMDFHIETEETMLRKIIVAQHILYINGFNLDPQWEIFDNTIESIFVLCATLCMFVRLKWKCAGDIESCFYRCKDISIPWWHLIWANSIQYQTESSILLDNLPK